MNKSKKTIKGTKEPTKKKNIIDTKVWVIIGVVLGIVLMAAVLFDQLYKRPLVTIDGQKYYLEDLTYQFYTTESNYYYINQFYGGTYWDTPHNAAPNMTVREYAKLETINNVIFTETLYNDAIAEGYTLTEEELNKIDEDVTSTLEQGFSDAFIKRNGFTPEYLKGVFSKITLANRYKQDIVDSFDIDDEAIKAGISFDEYRQYDIEYLYISTEKNDEAGNPLTMDEEEKKAANVKITALREKALSADDWSALLPEGETELQYRESSLLPKDTFFSEDIMGKVLSMNNGDVSEVFEDKNGYYVVRMDNNNSFESYERAVDEAITKKEEETFSEEYNNNIYPNHTFKVNDNALRNLRMGLITMDE